MAVIEVLFLLCKINNQKLITYRFYFEIYLGELDYDLDDAPHPI